VLTGLIAAYLVATTAVVDNGRHGIHLTSIGTSWAGTHLAHPDWIDRAVGEHGSVVVLWSGWTTAYPVWEDEFFNRSLGTVYDLDGAPLPDPLPESAAKRAPSGVLLSDGRPIHARYVLASSSLTLAGRLVEHDPVGVDLYRVDGPIVVLPGPTIRGLYRNDTWSGRSVSYERVDCSGGKLAVALESDPELFRSVQTVVAHEDGRVVATAHIVPTGQGTLTVPLIPDARGRCSVRFSVAHTAVPALVEPGSSDPRRLGAHFLGFTYTAP
jgi:hypothetical protein